MASGPASGQRRSAVRGITVGAPRRRRVHPAATAPSGVGAPSGSPFPFQSRYTAG
jgi:hypothetical protein